MNLVVLVNDVMWVNSTTRLSMRWAIGLQKEILINTFRFAQIVWLSIHGIYNNRRRLEAYGLGPASLISDFNMKSAS